jgi:MFS family permease
MSPWAPLRHKVFFAIFVAQLASNIGTLMQNVGSAWLMGDLHATPVLVALVQTATFLPVLLVGILAGALADIMDRRRLLLGTQTWMMVCAGLLAVLAFTGSVTRESLLALTFALGLGNALNAPAWQAIQPELVPQEEFGQAVALSSLTYNVGRSIGPALGGLLVAAAGPGWVFAINAVSFIGTVGVLWAWRPDRVESQLPVESLAGATKAALRYGAHAPILRGVLVRVALLAFPAFAVQALLPVVVRSRLHEGSTGYGVLLACFGVGAIVAAIARPRVVQHLSPDRLMLAAGVIVTANLAIDGLVRQPWVIGAGLFFGGGAWSSATITTNIAAVSVLPAWVRARGLGWYALVINGALAVGAATWGAVANGGIVTAHLVAAGVMLTGAVAGTHWPLARTVGLDLRPDPRADPDIALTPLPTDGPVLVTVTYRVTSTEMAEFAELMRDVEQHRRRTGAYQWGLFRDLAEPDRFVETFHVGSWAEHLRQHQRHTTGSVVSRVRVFTDRDTGAAHLVSAYSPGALEPFEHTFSEPVEELDAVD